MNGDPQHEEKPADEKPAQPEKKEGEACGEKTEGSCGTK
jgi:hypothetical protein